MICPTCKNPVKNTFEACEWCGSSVRQNNDKLDDNTYSSICDTCKGLGKINSVSKTFIGKMSTQIKCPECEGKGRI
jgi:DnaJ-class molecular chaperone